MSNLGFPHKYGRKLKKLKPEFFQDVIDTINRINKKDGKAFGLRIYRSISRRFKIDHPRTYMALLFLEYLGAITSWLETPEEFKERNTNLGLIKRGKRRKYYKIATKAVPQIKYEQTYKKVMWNELGIEIPFDEDYPV